MQVDPPWYVTLSMILWTTLYSGYVCAFGLFIYNKDDIGNILKSNLSTLTNKACTYWNAKLSKVFLTATGIIIPINDKRYPLLTDIPSDGWMHGLTEV